MHENKAPTNVFTFGTCSYARTGPPETEVSKATKILNVVLSFEEALKLNLAVDECVRKLNSYKKSTREGKKRGLNLAIHLHQRRITVNEEKV
jgi:hypothetical protein